MHGDSEHLSAERAGTSPATPPGGPTSSPAPTESGGTGAATTSLPPVPTTRPATRTINLYYSRAASSENLNDPFIVPLSRKIDASRPVGRGALEALLAGPAAEERRAGFGSDIPDGTRLLDLNIAGGLATVDLTGNYQAGGGTLSMTARLAEVVFTITQFTTVDQVTFRLDGDPLTVFSSEGLVLDGPVGRDDYRGIMPGIFVDGPAWGATVSRTIHVAGEAAVFEAVFMAELLAPDGSRLTEPAAVLTDNGVGWGGFDATIAVPPSVPASSRVILRVFESSARDGSDINVLDIPITIDANA